MKLLLDTHIWLWSLLRPEELGRSTKRLLAASRTELWLSPVSVWEFLLLVERGRVRVDGEVDTWLEEALRSAPMREAVLTWDVARESRRIDLSHEDPADRFLAATARVMDLTLLTSDERLLAGRGFSVLGNR